MGPEDNIFRNLILRGVEAEQGRDWMAYVCGHMGCVPSEFVIPGSECLGTWGTRSAPQAFTTFHQEALLVFRQ